MMRGRSGSASASRVTALLEDEALSFLLPAGATFEDLADQLARLCARMHTKPVAVTVRIGSSNRT